MFIEGADNRFDYDAWYGIYDADLTAEEILAGRGDVSQGSWGYIDSSLTSGKLGSGKKTFTFSSSDINPNAKNPPKIGGSYNLVLFYNDRPPNGYVVARMIPFTIPEFTTPSFGLTSNGVTVNADGSWSVEMFLENADTRFEFDAWYGIYDTSVTPEALLSQGYALSQGAWDYVVPGADHHSTALASGSKLTDDRYVFTFNSSEIDEKENNPTLGGTYNVFLFFTDGKLGGNTYTVAADIQITIPSAPTPPSQTDPEETTPEDTTPEDTTPEDTTPEDTDGDESHTHAYSNIKYDESGHWSECDCGKKKAAQEHIFSNDDTCLVCRFVKPAVDTSPEPESTAPSETEKETGKETSSKKETETDDVDNDDNNDDEDTEDDGGCGSVISASAIILISVIALFFSFKKEKKQKKTIL